MNEKIKQHVEDCNIEMPFAYRVERFWNWFVENEKKLSEMIQPKTSEDANELTAFINEGTSLISDNLYYNLSVDNEFSFSVEGWPDLFILYPYIISRMPDCLKSRWKFNPFNKGTDKAFGFRMFGTDIDTSRIMIRASYIKESDSFHISYYEKNLNKLSEDESDSAMWVMLENTLGEGIEFKYIDEIERASKSKGDMISLPDLKKHIKKTLESYGQKFVENPKEVYSGYRMKPQESDDLRYDVITGTTCLDSLVDDYYNDSTDIFDHINSFGAKAVFIIFPNPYELDGNDIIDLRHELEDRISEEILEPMNLGQVIGGATGTHNCYIDLIVFDFFAFINSVTPILEQYPNIPFYLSEFRQHSELISLTDAVSATSSANIEE